MELAPVVVIPSQSVICFGLGQTPEVESGATLLGAGLHCVGMVAGHKVPLAPEALP